METFCCKGKRLANYQMEYSHKKIRFDNKQNSKKYMIFKFNKDDSIDKNLEQWEKDKKKYLF